jgi:hypothetical protein
MLDGFIVLAKVKRNRSFGAFGASGFAFTRALRENQVAGKREQHRHREDVKPHWSTTGTHGR